MKTQVIEREQITGTGPLTEIKTTERALKRALTNARRYTPLLKNDSAPAPAAEAPEESAQEAPQEIKSDTITLDDLTGWITGAAAPQAQPVKVTEEADKPKAEKKAKPAPKPRKKAPQIKPQPIPEGISDWHKWIYAIANRLPEITAAADYRADGELLDGRASLTHTPTGTEFFAIGNRYGKRGKTEFHIRMSYTPPGRSKSRLIHHYTRKDTPTATVSNNRHPAAVARDIKRRLIDPAIPIFEEARDSLIKRFEKADKQLATMKAIQDNNPLIALVNYSHSRGAGEDPEPGQVEYYSHHTHIDKLIMYIDQRTKLTLDNLPPAILQKVLTLISEETENKHPRAPKPEK